MRSTSVREIAIASKGRLFGDGFASVENVKIDSRECTSGDMFVCVVGDVNDGHQFAMSAYENGCRVFMMSDPKKATEMLQLHEDSTVILVQNTVESFRLAAVAYLSQFSVHKIAVTGSVGKTTTKLLTAKVLSTKFNTIYAQKNLNTELGICLTCFCADENTQAIVFEVAMDRKGEIEENCSWLLPETCIITNVGISHLEKLGSKENIAKAKLEITKHMNRNMPLIYNCDSQYLSNADLDRLTRRNFFPVPVGKSMEAAVAVSSVYADPAGIKFSLKCRGQLADVSLPLLGVHNAENAALAAACGLQYGISLEQSASALLNAEGMDDRLHLENLRGITLIDDSYNASPASMAAGLDVLENIPANRRVAVLADMYELGSEEKQGHLDVGKRVGENRIDVLYAIGKNCSLYAKAARDEYLDIEIHEFPDAESAASKVIMGLKAGDVVLVKGSNSTHVSDIAKGIRKCFQKY